MTSLRVSEKSRIYNTLLGCWKINNPVPTTATDRWNGALQLLSPDDPSIPHGGVRFLVDDREVVRLQPVGEGDGLTRPRAVGTVQELNAVRLGFEEQFNQLRRNRLGTAAGVECAGEEGIPTDIRPAAESFGVLPQQDSGAHVERERPKHHLYSLLVTMASVGFDEYKPKYKPSEPLLGARLSSAIMRYTTTMNSWKLRRKVHVSWFLAVFCAGTAAGVILVQYGYGIVSVVWLATAGMALGYCLWRRRAYLLLVVLLAGAILGLWRGGIEWQQREPYGKLIGHTVTIEGVIAEDPDVGKAGERVLRVAVTKVDGHVLPGTIWVSTVTPRDMQRSDKVTIRGKLDEGFGSFVASMYRAHVQTVQRPQPGDVALVVRDHFAAAVRMAVPEPEASLGIGYLVGQRRALPPELEEALQIAGLTHIVVASGYNLTILVRLARRLFMRVSRFTAFAAASGLVVSFIAVTGASPSMSRAGLVAGLSLLAWYYGRKFHPLVLLPLAAAVTLLVNPGFGWNDLGWQLSFAAFAGVMIVAPLGQRYFFGDKKPGTVRQILGETIAAQLCTLPILVLAFGEFSNVAILANLLVLPLVPLAMLLTFVAGIGALIVPGTAEMIGMPASALLHYMTTVAQFFAGLPWAQTQITINGWVVAVAYGFLAAVCLYVWRKTRYNLRDSNIVE